MRLEEKLHKGQKPAGVPDFRCLAHRFGFRLVGHREDFRAKTRWGEIGGREAS